MSNSVKRERIEIIVVITVAIIVFLIMFFVLPKQQGRTYDCGMADWHPDIPQKVREECRKLRAENFNKDLQKPK